MNKADYRAKGRALFLTPATPPPWLFNPTTWQEKAVREGWDAACTEATELKDIVPHRSVPVRVSASERYSRALAKKTDAMLRRIQAKHQSMRLRGIGIPSV